MPLSSRVRKLNFEAFHKMSKDISLFEQFANDSGVDGLRCAEMPLTLNTRPLPLLVLFLLSSFLLPLFLAVFIRSNQSSCITTYTLRPISITLQSLHSPTSHQTLSALQGVFQTKPATVRPGHGGFASIHHRRVATLPEIREPGYHHGVAHSREVLAQHVVFQPAWGQ
jgi:hypothetical protein